MNSENTTAQIVCTNYSHNFHFSQLQYIHIANLEFIGCRGNRVQSVEELTVCNALFRGLGISKRSSQQWLIANSALVLFETRAQVINSTFVSNRGGTVRENTIYHFQGLLPQFISAVYPNTVGGAIFAAHCENLDIIQSVFENNGADYGGAIFADNSTIVVRNRTMFMNNSAANYGGAICSFSSNMTIEESELLDNIAEEHGGALCSYNSTTAMKSSNFDSNSAGQHGGVLYADNSSVKMSDSDFINNSASVGAVIYAQGNSMLQYQFNLRVVSNSASRYAIIYLTDSEFSGHYSVYAIFSNNLGSLVAFSSNITLMGLYIRFDNNQPLLNTTHDFQEGGAVTLIQSNLIFFHGIYVCFRSNFAENGGAIHSIESKIFVNGHIFIKHNTATRNGGGVFLLNSELNCQRTSIFKLYNNTATYKGGGIHADSSSIKAASDHLFLQCFSCTNDPSIQYYTGTRLQFAKNKAERGGGLSLEANAKLYILKHDRFANQDRYDVNTTIFTANIADYGGAVYVDDNSNSGTSCISETKAECFFQVLALYDLEVLNIATQSMHFSQNYANISGSTLYGGLLDRCAVSQFAEVRNIHPENKPNLYELEYNGQGIVYFYDVSTPYNLHYLNTDIKLGANFSVSSNPVRVCLCVNNEQDCTHQKSVEVIKGGVFIVSLVAVDQIGQPVNAAIQTSLHFTESGLAEGQLTTKIPAECTNLMFNVVSPHNHENLTLYASNGPCKNAELSRAMVEIHFLPCSCPVGLQVSGMNKTNCTCECHSSISQYVEQCDSHSGSFIKNSQLRSWFSYFNNSGITGYLVYPNCPFDYCLSTSPPVDLNQPNGADAQCAFNRSSLLCGSCQPGLSLSLGSSHCLPCPSYWPVLLIAIIIVATLAGIALVALSLVLNMTVAVGTLNGIIFYANIVYANRSILLPFQETSFITVLVSWLNLELGIDTCYFPGMDTYIKTWLQLAFPAYVILLVVSVIIISSYSIRFSNLIGKKDPVATLATLILLSYAKLLEICFKSLSVGILEYPDGSSEMLWLPDATVKYLSGKHIPLFIAAVFILLVGLFYTALLFSWQWLLYLPGWRIFRWSRNPKIQTFIETYHTPYTPKHRYWTGLLLIARIILYLVAAVNVSNDPGVALTAVVIIMSCIFALSRFMGSRLYKKWSVDMLETIFYLNILCFAAFTWYCLGECRNKEAVAYTSVIIAFIILLLIIVYHIYTYTTLFSRIKKTKPIIIVNGLFTEAEDPKCKPRQQTSPLPDNDIHRFSELLDMIDRPVNTNDYTVLSKQKSAEPTYSVVEMCQERDLAPPDPEEASTKGTRTAAEPIQN